MTLLTEKEESKKKEPGFATRAIHAGQIPDPTTGALSTPIFQTTTYAQEAVGVNKGYTYSRTGNPTVAVLEKNLASLEKGLDCACFSSGMAAITAVFSTLSQGDHAIISEVVYGGTPRLCNSILSRFGIESTYVDTSSVEAVQSAVREN